MSFLNPWFFIGAMTAAIPILLHLIKRERARKIEFPTLMFLRRISKKTIRYQKLRHLLLLLLRVLAFLFMVLAFTRPFREILQASASPGRLAAAHIILLDNSMSMAYGDRWDRARKAAAEIARRAEPGDKLALLEFSNRVVARTRVTSDSSDVLRELETGVKLSDRPTKYSQALRAAEKLALEAGTGRRVIHLISDFQKSAIAADEHDFRLGSAVELRPVDVGSNEYVNLTFGDVQLHSSGDTIGGEQKIKASLVNFGTEDQKNVPVNLFLDGRRITDKRVDVAKSSTQGVDFTLTGLTPGLHQIVLEVEEAKLTRDNRFYMTVEARGSTPVVSVESPTSGRGGRAPSFFLVHALNISSLSPYRLMTITPQKVESQSSFSSGLVIWNNTPGGNATLQKKLRSFVTSGGGLILVMGDSVAASEFNRSFGSWLPFKIDESPLRAARGRQATRPGEEYAMLTDIRLDHPVFRPFNEPHSGSFSSAKFFNYARLMVGTGGEVLARFDNGSPALAVAEVEKGRVLIFASSADDEWNDLTVKAVFVPFWQQMLRYLDNYQGGRMWVEIGETIAPRKLLQEAAHRQGRTDVDLNQAVVTVNPDKERVPLPPTSDSVLVDTAGFYEIRSTSFKTSVGVNTVRSESDLTHGNVEEMVAGWISPDVGASPIIAADERMSVVEQERRQRLWRFLLLAVLVFLLSEGILANELLLKPE